MERKKESINPYYALEYGAFNRSRYSFTIIAVGFLVSLFAFIERGYFVLLLITLVLMTLIFLTLFVMNIHSSRLCDIPQTVCFFQDMMMIKYPFRHTIDDTIEVRYKYIQAITSIDDAELKKHGRGIRMISPPIKLLLKDGEAEYIFNLEDRIVLEMKKMIVPDGSFD